MAITRKDIAEQAGVAISTVGMILGGRGERYSPKTRRKVHAVAKRLNYRTDMAARSLKMNRSFLIGVLLNTCNKNLAMDFLRGLQSALAEKECSPVVFSHDSVKEEMESLRRCQDRRVDGLIVNVTFDEDSSEPIVPERFSSLLQDDLPVVEVFGRFLPGVAAVNIDNVAAGHDAASHLIELGHQRIVMLAHEHYDDAKESGMGLHFDAWQRYVGYKQAMQGAGLEPVVMTHALLHEGKLADPQAAFFQGGEKSFDAIMRHESKPTAVVCYSDHQAYGLIRAARSQGIPIPDRLSVIGYGDNDLSKITNPTISTMAVPAWQVGRTATKMLLSKINDDVEAKDVLERSELIARESTAKR